jgi:hypothetical protein
MKRIILAVVLVLMLATPAAALADQPGGAGYGACSAEAEIHGNQKIYTANDGFAAGKVDAACGAQEQRGTNPMGEK